MHITLWLNQLCVYTSSIRLGIYLHPLGIPLISALLSVPSPLGALICIYIKYIQYLQFGHITPRYGSRGGGAGHVPFLPLQEFMSAIILHAHLQTGVLYVQWYTQHTTESSGTHNTSDLGILHISPVHTTNQSNAFNTPVTIATF